MQKPDSASERRWPDYRTVWRWHFYAGLLCIPFVLWLSVTGSIYLFKPQIERWLERPYDHLQMSGASARPADQVSAALAAVPGSVLNAYELPGTSHSAARVLVGQGDRLLRVYVHPETLKVLGVVDEDERFMRVIFHLHGELLQGDRGSMIVETAASWTIVMLITGLFLWWPRDRAGLGGVLYPRLARGGRSFWRDLHAVTGLWVSFFALFLLVSGLPWAKSWGGMLKEVRQWRSAEVQQDWSTGRSSELAARRLANEQPEAGGNNELAARRLANSKIEAGGNEHRRSGRQTATSVRASTHENGHHTSRPAVSSRPVNYAALDLLASVVAAARLEPPVLITPPSGANARWLARSDTQNRPRRVTLVLDGDSGAIVSRQDFRQKPFIDRAVGVGVAAHEGQLFGSLNQALGLFTTTGLILMCISAIQLWWKRRPAGALGAPPAIERPRLAFSLFVLIACLGILLPLFGATVLLVALIDAIQRALKNHTASFRTS